MRNKQGSALITALFIMTLVAIAAAAMSKRLQLEIYRTELIVSRDQIYLASEAVPFWAMDIIKQNDPSLMNRKKDGSVGTFPQELTTLVPGISISGKLYDLQALFNLNNLSDPQYYAYFVRLLSNVLSKQDRAGIARLIYSIHYWISPFQNGLGQDDERSYYLSRKPPYLPANQLMQNVTELRLIHGVNQNIYKSLLPYITVLPTVTPININTAPRAILKTLSTNIKTNQINEILEARKEGGITNLQKITPLLEKLHIPMGIITLDSNYFLCVSKVQYHEFQQTHYAVLKRTRFSDGKTRVGMIHVY